MKTIEKLAWKMALEQLNNNRAEHKPEPLPALRRIENSWWKLYGQEYLEAAGEAWAETYKDRADGPR